jgi:hypothetical protein
MTYRNVPILAACAAVAVLATAPTLEARSGVFGGGPFYSGGQAVMDTLRASGFTTVVLWTIHVDAASGDLILNDIRVVSNGAYVGDSGWPGRLATLKQAPTSVNRIEVSVGSAGVNDFGSVRTLMAAQGTGTGSILYRNFLALKNATGAVAIDFDDEMLYDVNATVSFGVMLADIGYHVTLCPYTNTAFWSSVRSQINSQRAGAVDRVYLQVYAGGAGNDPASWNGAVGMTVDPGVWSRHGSGCTTGDTPATVQSKMTSWRSSAGILGGFMWLYDDIQACSSQGTAAQYAAAINNSVPSSATPTPVPTATPSGTAVPITSGATYGITNQTSGKCVDAAASATANGTFVQQYTCNNTAAQQWILTATDSGYYRIATKNAAGQVWDVAGGATATGDGVKVALWTYGSGTNQQWQPSVVSGPYYKLVARHSGRCLDVPSASTADSVQLQQWACNGTGAQSFSFKLVSGPTATSTSVNLSPSANVNVAYSDGTTFPSTGGIDGVGYAYSSALLGTSMTWSSATFNFGAANVLNGVRNKTITLPAGQFSTLLLLGTGVNGDQLSQTVRVNYSDGTSSTFTQTFSNWLNASQAVAGQSIAKQMAYRNTSTGVKDNRVFNLYGYSFALNNTRVVSSLVLPATNNVSVLAVTLR